MTETGLTILSPGREPDNADWNRLISALRGTTNTPISLAGFLRFVEYPTALTISGGVVDVSAIAPATLIPIDTEAAGAIDNLDTINGGVAGQVLLIRSYNAARVVTAKHGIDNIWLGADIILSFPRVLWLVYSNSYWVRPWT